MMNQYLKDPVVSCSVVQVIKLEARRGSGDTDDDPVRIITQYWDFEGNLLADVDLFHQEIEREENEELIEKTRREIREADERGETPP